MSDLTDDEKIQRMMQKSQALASPAVSSLPDDPTLTADARALRAKATTSMEILSRVANDENAPMAMRISASKAMLPYEHKPQTVKSEIAIDDVAQSNNLAQTLAAMVRRGELTKDELIAINRAHKPPTPEAVH